MQEAVQDLMARRRDRIIAIILGFKEKEMDQYLPKDVQIRFRKLILDQINDLFDLYCDISKSNVDDEGVSINELYLAKLDEIYEAVTNGKLSEY